MKKIIQLVIIGYVAVATIACEGQTKEKEEAGKTLSSEKTEGQNPKIKTKVNKQYDSKGNLIRFDSTYSYHYTSRGHDSTKIALDSVFKEFKLFYHKNMASDIDKRFNDVFLIDSLFKYDFLNEDYFRKRFELNMNKMSEMFRQMDSLKTVYLKNIQPEKSKSKN